MRFKCRFLKKKFLLLLITLGIGSALYANDELKSLADSLRRMIDEKPLFIQQKEQRINRIKCLLKGSGLTLEQKYKINFQLCNEYKKFVVDSAIHYVDQNLEIARKLNNRDLKNQSSLQLSLLYSSQVIIIDRNSGFVKFQIGVQSDTLGFCLKQQVAYKGIYNEISCINSTIA